MGRWAYVQTLPAAMVADEPVLRSWLEQACDEARMQAHQEGAQLVGDPELHSQPMVLAEGWGRDAEGNPVDQLVAEPHARVAGSTAPVTAHTMRLEWDTADVPSD